MSVRIKIYTETEHNDILLLKHKNLESYSFINLSKGYIETGSFESTEEAFKYLDREKEKGKIKNYRIVDDDTFLEDGVFIGNYFVPNKNPKKINCCKDDLVYEGKKIVGVKKMKFTCDHCSGPMSVIKGPHGFFLGCLNWKTSPECKKNAISLNILDE